LSNCAHRIGHSAGGCRFSIIRSFISIRAFSLEYSLPNQNNVSTMGLEICGGLIQLKAEDLREAALAFDA
jgi:hypothetical protein